MNQTRLNTVGNTASLSDCSKLYSMDEAPIVNNGVYLIVPIATVVLIVAPSNIILLWGLWKTKQTSSYTHKFLMLISFGDLFIGILVEPVLLFTVIKKYNEYIQFRYSFHFCMLVFIFNMTLTFGMALDRYFYIAKPNFHLKYSEQPTFKCFVVLMFIISVAIAISSCKVSTIKDCKIMGILFLFLTTILIVLGAASIVVNMALILYVHKNAKISRGMSIYRRKNQMYENKLSKTIGIISSLLVIAYIPLTGSTINIAVITLITDRFSSMKDAFIIFIFLAKSLVMNSALNGLVYISRNGKIKRYYRKLFK